MKKKFDRVVDMLKNGSSVEDVARDDPATYIMHYSGIERLHKSFLSNKEPRNFKSEVIVLWGLAGTGKTRSAHALFEKGENGVRSIRDCQWTGQFLLNYDEGVETVVFDDFDYKTMSRVTFLKLCDQYEMSINIKNGCANWRPKRIVFTCNDDPKYWYNYSGGVEDAAVQRRLDIVAYFDRVYDLGLGELHSALEKYRYKLGVVAPQVDVGEETESDVDVVPGSPPKLVRCYTDCGWGMAGPVNSQSSPDFSFFTQDMCSMQMSPLNLSH